MVTSILFHFNTSHKTTEYIKHTLMRKTEVQILENPVRIFHIMLLKNDMELNDDLGPLWMPPKVFQYPSGKELLIQK